MSRKRGENYGTGRQSGSRILVITACEISCSSMVIVTYKLINNTIRTFKILCLKKHVQKVIIVKDISIILALL